MFRSFLLPLALLFAATPASHASNSGDRVRFGEEITISPNETVDDVVCAFCSVHIHGNVRGDVAVLLGNVTLDEGQSISGDVAIFGGDIHLSDTSRVGGDVAILGGDAHAPGGTIAGSQAILPGRLWIFLPLAPFLLLAGIIWLIVYMLQRNRYRYPAYPQGRGIPPTR